MSVSVIIKCDGGCSSVIEHLIPVGFRPLDTVADYLLRVASEAHRNGWQKRGDKYYCPQCFRLKKGDTVTSTWRPRLGAIGRVTSVAKDYSWANIHWNAITLPSRMKPEHLQLVEKD